MVRVEAVIIAVFGAVLGLAIGIVFGWALQQALSDLGVTQLAIPVGQLIVPADRRRRCSACVAAIWPARRAAKLERARSRSLRVAAAAGARQPSAILHAHAAPAPARRHHAELPEGEPVGSALAAGRRSRRGSTASSATSRSCRTATWRSSRSTCGRDDGLHVLRHSTGARARAGGQPALAGHPARRSARRSPTASTTTSTIPAHVSADDLPRIEEEMRAIVAADQPFVREDVSREEALRRLADQPFKREIVEGVGTDEAPATVGRRARPSASTATTAGRTCASVRTCRPPGGSARSS